MQAAVIARPYASMSLQELGCIMTVLEKLRELVRAANTVKYTGNGHMHARVDEERKLVYQH